MCGWISSVGSRRGLRDGPAQGLRRLPPYSRQCLACVQSFDKLRRTKIIRNCSLDKFVFAGIFTG